MKFDPKEIQDKRVRRYDGWYKDTVELPNTYGVYIVVDDKEDVRYIGHTVAMDMQEVAFAKWEEGKGKSGTQLGYLLTFSPEKAASLYKDLVAKYKPAEN